MKKSLSIVLSLLLVVLMAACSGGNEVTDSASSTAESSKTTSSEGSDSNSEEESSAATDNTAASSDSKVVIGLNSDPQNIGPFQGMSSGRIGILYTVYEFLVTTEGGEMYGVLMKDYEQIDELTYNCEIYDYIYDQEGNHLTAEDVAWSYQMGIDSGNLPKLGSIDSVEVVSDYVVQFKFNALAIGDLGALWMECPIVTQAAYEASDDEMATDPVSTTAYQCTEFTSGSKLVFTNTQNYWQTDDSLVRTTSEHNVDVIEFDIITDSAQLTNALKTGAIDVTNWLAASDVEDFDGVEGFEVSKIPDNVTYMLLFNCDEDQGVFANNPELRQAIAYAIDKQQLIDGAYDGNGNVAKTFGNTNYSDYVDSWLDEDYYEQDLDKAKDLLSAAGGDGLSLKLMTTSDDASTTIATILQAQLAQIGVTVEINAYDSQLVTEYTYQPEQWDLFLDQGGSTSYLVNVWKLKWDNTGFTHGGAENFVKDDELQTLLEAAMDVDGHSDETMDAFHQYLKEECYGLGLLQYLTNIAHTDTITEIVVDARGQVTPGACSYSF